MQTKTVLKSSMGLAAALMLLASGPAKAMADGPRVAILDKEISLGVLNQTEKGKPGAIGMRARFQITFESGATLSRGDEVTATLSVDGKVSKPTTCKLSTGTPKRNAYIALPVVCEIDEYLPVKRGKVRLDVSYYMSKTDKTYESFASFRPRLVKSKTKRGIRYAVSKRPLEGHVLLSLPGWVAAYRQRKAGIPSSVTGFRVATRISVPVAKARELYKRKITLQCSGPVDIDARVGIGDRIPPESEMSEGDFSMPLTTQITVREKGTYKCVIKSGRTVLRSFEFAHAGERVGLAESKCATDLGMPGQGLVGLATLGDEQLDKKASSKEPFLYHLALPSSCKSSFH